MFPEGESKTYSRTLETVTMGELRINEVHLNQFLLSVFLHLCQLNFINTLADNIPDHLSSYNSLQRNS